MEQLANEIRPGYADRELNQRLTADRPTKPVQYERHFTQSEEYFIRLPEVYLVPRFPIHHDVRQSVPRADYIEALRVLMDDLLSVAPGFFSDLSYFFDPAEILRPCFYRLYRIGEEYYLYLLRLDLLFRPLDHEVVERGSNDWTAAYRTDRLYFESDFIPLSGVVSELGKPVAFVVKQTISQTWVGESGTGYLVRGIWMDGELTRFFSKLFLPKGARVYPFFPYTCKYKTLCLSVLDPTPEDRRRLLPYLHRAFDFLAPQMEFIQKGLRNQTFSENLPIFMDIKGKVPEVLSRPWTSLAMTPYLNANEMKEFRLDY